MEIYFTKTAKKIRPGVPKRKNKNKMQKISVRIPQRKISNYVLPDIRLSAGRRQTCGSIQNSLLVEITSDTPLCNHFASAVWEGRFAVSDGYNPSKNYLSHFEVVFDLNNNPGVYWANKFFHIKVF